MEVGGKGRKLKRDSYGNLLIIIKTKGYLRTYVIATIRATHLGTLGLGQLKATAAATGYNKFPRLPQTYNFDILRLVLKPRF